MAKKSRRAKKRARKRSIPSGGTKQPPSAPGPTVTKDIEARAEQKAEKLAEEYRYVYSDLKRIAILAGAMLAALIILSFVIG